MQSQDNKNCPFELQQIIKKTVKISSKDTRSYEQIWKEKASQEMSTYLDIAYRRVNQEEIMQSHVLKNEQRIENLLAALQHSLDS